MPQLDWLSHLLKMITVTSQLEVRCAYGAPWRVSAFRRVFAQWMGMVPGQWRRLSRSAIAEANTTAS